jgi:4-hydroxybenzoate polyprenyltransferase
VTTARTLPQLVRAAHPEPTAAVSGLAAMLAGATGLTPARCVLVTAAVLAGQLSIGWSNDLIDRDRDAVVRRDDKPLVKGTVSPQTVRVAAAVAVGGCVALSALCGIRSALVHVVLVVGSGWAYNVGLKATVWSWAPYAVAFGSLPSVVTLADSPPRIAPTWMTAAGAMLGVGAHLVNVLPDLGDDVRTGVRGLPHRLGRGRAQVSATCILAGASVVAFLGPPGSPTQVAWAGLGVVAVLAVISLRGTGSTPFRAAIGIALVDVLMLVLTS